MRAGALAEALRTNDLICDVEERDALAVLRGCESTGALWSPERRQMVLRLAREHGFTHVAVELSPEPAGG